MLSKLLNFCIKNLSILNQWSTNYFSRIWIVCIVFCLAFAVIGVRIIELATDSSHLMLQAGNNKILNYRKSIEDRNGTILAINLPVYSAFLNVKKVLDLKKNVIKLKKALHDLDEKKILEEVDKGKNFVWVKRNLTPKEYETVFNLGITGLEFEKNEKRFYTYGNLLSHVIGYVGIDNHGLAGLEKSFQEFLTNSDISLNKHEFNQPLALSIDIRIQNIVSEELDSAIKEFSAVGGVGIVADPNTGEVLAISAKPDFDPNNPNKATSEQLFNQASLGVYECGSVLKTITMAIAFDSKSVTMRDAYDISSFRVANFDVRDYHQRRGLHTVPEIFYNSSNIGVAKIALEVGKFEFKKYLKLLGLTEKLSIELPEKSTPLYPVDKKWSDLSTVTISYGYGISISPLHFVQAMMPIVNGGYFRPLTLIKKKEEVTKIKKRVLSKATSKNLNTLLRLGVKLGTGKKANVPGYMVGGKSGTANILHSNGKYDKKNRRSSFVAVFPTTKPQYVVYLMLDKPQGIKSTYGFATAGWTVAPAIAKIISRIGAISGMKPYEDDDPDVKKLELELKKKVSNEV